MPIRNAVVVCALVSCIATGVSAQSVRDSAGIRIVSNDRPMWTGAQALRLVASPAVVIGDRDGDPYELNRVVGVSRLADGRFVLANGGSFELRFYDSTGTYLKTSGRRGRGPGEFSRMEALMRQPGDTLAVLDQGTVLVYTAGGNFVRALSPRVPPIPGLSGPPMVLGVFPGDRRVVTHAINPPARSRGASWVESIPVFIVDAQNVPTHDLGHLPFMQFVMADFPRPPWFGAMMTVANDAQLFYLGLGTEYVIRAYTSDGRLTRIIRRRWVPSKVTTADIESYVVEWGKRWIKEAGAAAEKQYAELRADPYATTLPAFSQFVVDGIGRLWVREPHAADAAWAGQLSGVPLVPSTWNVFDPDGRWLCDVVLPARFLVKEIGRDYVLGVARGEDDAESVRMYRLAGGAAPGKGRAHTRS
jgi:hypothetical protein